ncbi:hypothetical protein [Kribbella deserti]|uniref:ATP-grasp domain-containing protein n=1 Tax=Kribbella deserti TaxID=1926257 RepID=A0ABV6QLH2_9ACTN
MKILYLSQLAYQANGRRYCDEDIWLTARLRRDFDLAVCHPVDAVRLMGAFDGVVIRNSGPVIDYQREYGEFRAAAIAQQARVYPQLTGKADMIGKQYLLDLTAADYPVIPTYIDLDSLPTATGYVVKPQQGSESIGLRKVDRETLATIDLDGMLVQPLIDFQYEVSFYFIDHDFRYALYAPDPDRRWQLERYEPTAADLDFARLFIEWNDIDHGIQRVDACRTRDDRLLLVEVEDLNPYLSLDVLDEGTQDAFVQRFAESLRNYLG